MNMLSGQFSRFAELECAASPLYRHLAAGAAADNEFLAVAALANHGPVPNLFLAAVHDLLLQGQGSALGAYYQTVVGDRALLSPTAMEAFRSFVLEDPGALMPALQSRLVQTNEVRRASVLYLALCWIEAHHHLGEAALVEVSASAGLLLATDRYTLRIGHLQHNAPGEAGLVNESDLSGDRPAPDGLPPNLPAIVLHRHALNQFPPGARERFDEMLRAASQARPIFRIAMEGRLPHPHPICAALIYRDGELVTSVDPARDEAHGAWVEWLAWWVACCLAAYVASASSMSRLK